jgi:hypothetical protein
LPKFESDLVCAPCHHGKMIAASHSSVNIVMTERPGQLLHMDTVGPSWVHSMCGKWYVLVIVDDYSHYSWVFFLESKDECASDKEMEKSIFVDEELQGFDDDKDDPLQPSTSLPKPVPASTLEVEAPQATISSTAAMEASRVEGEIISESGALCHIQKANPPQQIIDNLNETVTRYSRLAHLSCFTNTLFVALFEPRDVRHALSYLSWVNAMHEELENFERNQVWTLVEPPRDVNVIGIRWVFKNK